LFQVVWFEIADSYPLSGQQSGCRRRPKRSHLPRTANRVEACCLSSVVFGLFGGRRACWEYEYTAFMGFKKKRVSVSALVALIIQYKIEYAKSYSLAARSF
ncbi:MAG: hypothetical protein ACJASO_002790, partial [Cyclobacteriaceae bacterium]